MKMKEVIAVDIGGTNLRFAIVKGKKIIRFFKKKTPSTKSKLLQEILSGISELKSTSLNGIGVACPGPLEKGIILNPPNIPFENLNLKRILEHKFKTKIEIENDALCVALAEYTYGCKKRNIIVFTLGTGIGSGIIIDGKPLNKGRGGSELGYLFLDKGKTLEELASGKAISKITKKMFGKELTLSELHSSKHKKAKALAEKITDYYAQGIGSAINVFKPDVVILSGGISSSTPSLISIIKRKSKKYILLQKKSPITLTTLNHPGIVGASLLLTS